MNETTYDPCRICGVFVSESIKKRILLVEDQTIVAMTEKMQLEKYGYSVHHVTTV